MHWIRDTDVTPKTQTGKPAFTDTYNNSEIYMHSQARFWCIVTHSDSPSRRGIVTQCHGWACKSYGWDYHKDYHFTQRMDGAERSIRAALHAPMHAIYRLRKMSEQSGSQEGPGLKCSQELWQEPALIPLVRYNSQFNIIPLLMLIFIQCIWRLCFTFRPAFSASYIIIQISLFIYTIYNTDGLYSNNPPLNPKGCL